jgi:hypothetical protein
MAQVSPTHKARLPDSSSYKLGTAQLSGGGKLWKAGNIFQLLHKYFFVHKSILNGLRCQNLYFLSLAPT